MIAIAKAIYKEIKYAEAYTLIVEKQNVEIKAHYDLLVDEVSKNRVNQQKLYIDANNEQLVKKLDDITMYTEIYLIIDFEYYKTKLSKARVLDIVTADNEKNAISDIFKKY
jgi:hypothetical protein